ncbi:MAG: hypothetical protein ACR2KW_02135 [Rubrobacter sp.]
MAVRSSVPLVTYNRRSEKHRSSSEYFGGEIEAFYNYGVFVTCIPVLLTVGLTIFTLASVGRMEEANRRGRISESGRQYIRRLKRRGKFLWAASFVSWGAFTWFLAGFVGAIG